MELLIRFITATVIGAIALGETQVQAKNFTQLNLKQNQSQLIASTPPNKVVDDWTDDFFYMVHPEMKGKKIQPSQTLYIREWNGMRKVIQGKLVWMDISCGSGTPEYGWMPLQVLDDLTDAIFYARHPELNNRPIRKKETALSQEWRSIYGNFPLDFC